MSARRGPIRLAFAVVDGTVRAVADWQGVPPGARPAAHCPLCAEPVLMKLGRVLAPHAAHRPGSRCPLQHEETALHYNVKHHLAAALRAAAGPEATLTLRFHCTHRHGILGETIAVPGLVPCPARLEEPLVTGWDAVEVEAGLSDVRPDVLLRRRGRPVATLEVHRTHAVTAAKVERLAAHALPWAEVAASAALYAEFTAWTPDRPLAVRRSHARAPWACDAHRERARARAVREHAGAADLAWAARLVDVYDGHGHRARDVLLLTGGASPALRWRRDDALLAALPPGPRPRLLRDAHAEFLRWADARRAEGVRVDSPMSWVDARALGPDADGAWAVGDLAFPPRFAFDGASGRWVRRRGVGTRAWRMAEALPAPRGGRR